ncbi:glycosyltransferase [Bacillus massiliglaciei]|uniref:glycosyltransferase n=1 Tax=Bacillus massiliglaciei TaxID=1816693 RepID=UPI000DA6213F|nr:glycosyltransferase [Bacillus massiliglaciei]
MKILLAKYKSYPRIGGVATYVSQLSKKLSAFGHEVDILAHNPQMTEIYTEKNRVKKKEIKSRLEHKYQKIYQEKYPYFTQWMIWRELETYTYQEAARSFSLEEYDIIHTQDMISTRAFQNIKPAGIPLISSFHNCKTREWYTSRQNELKTETEMQYIALEELFSVQSADRLIFPCNWLYQEMNQLGEIHSKTSIIPYGIDLSEFDRYSKKTVPIPETNEKLVICYPARLVPIKGHTYLLKALRSLKEMGHHFICWIIGDGILKNQLMKEADELDLSNDIAFLGGRKDIPSLLAASDIVVHPSIHDTLPFSIIEAQLAGKPVIATDVGGCPDMIKHGVTGYLVKSKESEGLIKYLDILLSSPVRRTEIGRAARIFAKNAWSLDLMVKKTLEVYEQSLCHRPSSSPLTSGTVLDLSFLARLEDAIETTDRGNAGFTDIEGKITNPFGKGIKLAAVHLIDHSNILLLSTETDECGNFLFSNIPPGKYSLLASRNNHSPVHSQSVIAREHASQHILIEFM